MTETDAGISRLRQELARAKEELEALEQAEADADGVSDIKFQRLRQKLARVTEGLEIQARDKKEHTEETRALAKRLDIAETQAEETRALAKRLDIVEKLFAAESMDVEQQAGILADFRSELTAVLARRSAGLPAPAPPVPDDSQRQQQRQQAARDAAARLPAIAARVAGVLSAGVPLGDAEAEQDAAALAAVEAAFAEDGSLADELVSNEAVRVALLRLVAFATRRDSRQGLGRVSAELAVAASAALLRLEPRTAWRARALTGFARKLLRMDTLQCCSRAFAAGVAQLAGLAAGGPADGARADGGPAGGGPADGGPAGGGPADGNPADGGPAGGGPAAAVGPAGTQAPQAPELGAGGAIRLLLGCCDLFAAVARLATAPMGAEGGPDKLQRWRRQQQQQLSGELAAALHDSRVLEHLSRWVLHVQLAEAGGRVPEGSAARAVLYLGAPMEGCSNSAELLPGPCTLHLQLSLGLAALCAADGGPSYGMPYELLLRLPLQGCGGQELRGAPGRGVLSRSALACMIGAVAFDCEELWGAPPRGWRAAAAVLLRAGWFAVASARAWADDAAEAAAASPGGAGAAAPRPPQQQQQQLVLAKADTIEVARGVLRALRSVLRAREEAAAPGSGPSAAQVEAEAAWWRLALEVAAHCPRWAVEERVLRELAAALDVSQRLPAGHDPLPPEPHWVVATALAGGLLPLWERQLRRAGREPGCPEATGLLRCMLDREGADGRGGLWALLAYGEPRQGAALVATWGKLLRTLAVPHMLSAAAGAWDAAGEAAPRTALASSMLQYIGGRLLTALDGLREDVLRAEEALQGAAAAPQAVAPAQQQLARMLALAALGWLPPLAELAHYRIALLHCANLWGTLVGKRITGAAAEAMAWLPVLAAECLRTGLGQGAAATGLGQGAAATGLGQGAAATRLGQGAAATAAASAADATAAVARQAADASSATAPGGGTLPAGRRPAVAALPAAPAAAEGAAAAEWRLLLLRGVGVVALLGDVCQGQVDASDHQPFSDHAWGSMIRDHCLVAAACPGEVRQAVRAAAAEAAAARGGGAGGGGGARRGARGASTRGERTGSTRPAATIPTPPGWSPQLLRQLAAKASARQECEWQGRASARLARQAELWAAGGGEDGGELAAAVAALDPFPLMGAVAAALVSSPAEARALLRTCANPACDNLAGDSEAGLPLRACGR